jgi:hypothetical protein
MTVKDVKKILADNNVSTTAYCVHPDTLNLTDCTYYLQREKGGKWTVFFEERNIKYDQTYHDTEDEACRQFIKIFYPKLEV